MEIHMYIYIFNCINTDIERDIEREKEKSSFINSFPLLVMLIEIKLESTTTRISYYFCLWKGLDKYKNNASHQEVCPI